MEQLVKWEKAKQAIIEAKSVDELLLIRDQAEAFRYAAKQAKESIDAVNNIAEIRIRAERRAGEFLSEPTNKQKPGQYQQRSTDSTVAPTLKELKVSKTESSNWQNIANIPQDDFEEHIEKTKKRKAELTTAGVLSLAKDIKRDALRKERSEQGKSAILPDNTKLYNDDFRCFRNADVEYGSVDLILTDPPYPKEYIPLWRDLGVFALDYLKKDGYLIAYSGQLYLDIVIQELSKTMSYCWTFCLYHTGHTQLVHSRNVICEWKPILVFKNGDPGKFRDTISDVLPSEKRDKTLHDWQQNKSAPEYIVNHFTNPGDVVCDPMAGAGTFLKVAKNLNRKIVGMEIDEKSYNIIKAEL